MSLRISNLATTKQIKMLKQLEYQGSGKYAAEKLTVQEAANILSELFEEKRLEQRDNIQYMEDNKWDY